MEGILGLVMNQLGSGGLDQIGSMLGLGDKKETEQAVGTAVGVLAGAMAQNASDETGAKSLDTALEKDHDGSIFENITGFLGNVMQGPGSGILGHVLGTQQPQVETAIAEKSGLSLEKVTPLLITVAPLVMGALGKLKREQNLDSTGGFATTLATERKQIEKADNGIDLGSILGMVGGLTGGGSSQQSSGGGGGGLLGMLGGLFGGKKKNG